MKQFLKTQKPEQTATFVQLSDCSTFDGIYGCRVLLMSDKLKEEYPDGWDDIPEELFEASHPETMVLPIYKLVDFWLKHHKKE